MRASDPAPVATPLELRPVRRAIVLGCVLFAAGCGSDPTAPREVRTIEVAPAPSEVTDERDEGAPSRGLPCDEQADQPIGLCGAATDNYKAAYNDDADEPERRTWLALHQLEIDGARWAPVPGTPLTSDEVRLARVDGETGELVARVEVVDGPADTVRLRNGPQRELWGVLLQVESSEALHDEPVVVRLLVDDGTRDLASVEASYRHDPTLADVPRDSLEYNGPGGRWVVAGITTATNLELGWE